jgi:hypothetical protein
MTWYNNNNININIGRPLGGNQFGFDLGHTTLYGKFDFDNGLLRLRQAYTDHEVLYRIPTSTALESALQKAIGQRLTK